jgi:ubiquinone/menaquinone biosynthesis C-methylase UbiE
MGVHDAYHLEELRIARDPSDAGHLQPPTVAAGARVPDLGGGSGHTPSAAYPDRKTFGLDVDLDALRLGRTLTGSVAFTCARAERLPFASGSFDVVIARVSLVYTDIPASVAEVSRVLRPKGMAWMVFHPLRLCWDQARRGNWKSWVFFGYVFANGLGLHVFQRVFPLFGQQESFQTRSAVRRLLSSAGFTDITIDPGQKFVVSARR